MKTGFLRHAAFWAGVIAAALAVMFIAAATRGFSPAQGYLYAAVLGLGFAVFGGIFAAYLERVLRGIIDGIRKR